MFKPNLKIIVSSGLTVFLAVLIIYFIAQAGPLNPSGTPAATGFTLDDIYNRLNTNAAAIAGNHAFAPSGTPTSTLHTLAEIYNKIPTINPNNLLSTTTYLGITGSIIPRGAFNLKASSTDQSFLAGYYTAGTLSGDTDLIASNVKSGVNIFGTIGNYGGGGYTYGDNNAGHVLTIATGFGTWNAANLSPSLVATSTTYGTSSVGTLLGHLWNGTGQGFTGGSWDNGGVDDYNNGSTTPSGRYVGGWTACHAGTTPDDAGNNWCNTSDNGAAYKDNSTGLIWSNTMNNSTYVLDGSDTWQHSLSWFIANNCTESSGNVCTKKSSSKTGCEANFGWHLPTEKQLMMAHVNGAYGNLEALGVFNYYWSNTTVSSNVGFAWNVYLSSGSVYEQDKTVGRFVRCVRPAP